MFTLYILTSDTECGCCIDELTYQYLADLISEWPMAKPNYGSKYYWEVILDESDYWSIRPYLQLAEELAC
jgi:hypothetical protein